MTLDPHSKEPSQPCSGRLIKVAGITNSYLLLKKKHNTLIPTPYYEAPPVTRRLTGVEVKTQLFKQAPVTQKSKKDTLVTQCSYRNALFW